MLSFIKRFLGKEQDTDVLDESTIVTPKDISEPVLGFTYDMIDDPVILGNSESKMTILLMDDQPEVFYLYDMDFKEIKRKHGVDVLDQFKIVKCVGPDAGFIAHKYLKDVEDELVIAILDITLGKIIKLEDGSVLLFDGVDIAVEIMDKLPKCQVRFCTGHMVTDTGGAVREFAKKFKAKTGLELTELYFSKNSIRYEYMFDLISKAIHINSN